MSDYTPETRSYTLAEALPREQALHAAEQATARQDTVAMLRALRNLQSFAE